MAVTTTISRPGTPATREVTAPAHEGDRTLVVLEAARAVLERGWMQDGWYRTRPRPLRQRLFGAVPGPDVVESACLVAAVALAGHTGGALTHVDRDSGPALDRVWEALQEVRHGRTEASAGAVAPVVRRARMRELVRWNDDAGRTRADVLDVVDRAISRTIMNRVAV